MNSEYKIQKRLQEAIWFWITSGDQDLEVARVLLSEFLEGFADINFFVGTKELNGYVIAQCCEMFFVEMNEQSASNA